MNEITVTADLLKMYCETFTFCGTLLGFLLALVCFLGLHFIYDVVSDFIEAYKNKRSNFIEKYKNKKADENE